jgi:hypothetical protein
VRFAPTRPRSDGRCRRGRRGVRRHQTAQIAVASTSLTRFPRRPKALFFPAAAGSWPGESWSGCSASAMLSLSRSSVQLSRCAPAHAATVLAQEGTTNDDHGCSRGGWAAACWTT